MIEDKHIVFSGEVQLAGWTNSHDSGFKFTLWVADEADADRLKLMTSRRGKTAGQRLMMSAVQIGEREEPIEQPINPLAEKPKGGELARLAGMWCGREDFAAWVLGQFPLEWQHEEEAILGASDEELCKGVVRAACYVSSLAELDHDKPAACRFDRLFRLPFSAVLSAGGGAQA